MTKKFMERGPEKKRSWKIKPVATLHPKRDPNPPATAIDGALIGEEADEFEKRERARRAADRHQSILPPVNPIDAVDIPPDVSEKLTAATKQAVESQQRTEALAARESDLVEEAASLSTDLGDAQDKLTKREEQLQEALDRLDDLQALISEKTEEVQALKDKLDADDSSESDTVTALKDSKKALRDSLKDLKAELESVTDERDTYKAISEDTSDDDAAETFKAEAEAAGKEATEFRKVAAESEAKSETLEKKLTAARERAVAVQKETDVLKKTHQGEVTTLTGKVSDLNKALATALDGKEESEPEEVEVLPESIEVEEIVKSRKKGGRFLLDCNTADEGFSISFPLSDIKSRILRKPVATNGSK